ncbi:TonB-linked SusC/RagA family outer membrane protein [Dyadobacter jejuensis]|uniref:TonB-linked SusC/RagA family outer membrane protein n=1 Tax=Dyadobacter jejuensis TaxID=1082580 RepID=A0A316AMC6_9BACT|nr:TonB-dependent receptor [Dyadobacter jejuensis]PWJ57950.1 TonB-linked SusC/RagA family outer membrane protein [Dyadobacter jejuensis]
MKKHLPLNSHVVSIARAYLVQSMLILSLVIFNSQHARASYEATEKTVKGRVVDPEDQSGIPGVTVLVKGTTVGVNTDADGKYSITVPSNKDILSFSAVGFVTQEITVGNKSIIDVTLQTDEKALDEVVVVGFGTIKKDAVVGAMTSVKPGELKVPASNLTTALAGRVSGLISYQTSGEPGANNAQFFVRGVASFNNQNGPLILIDNVELTVDDLARLQPDDIESFSVLKDPTTTAIYGARGANGVILVTTKSGNNGPAVVSIRVENSISTPVSLIKMADPITYMRLQNEAERTRGRFATYTEEKIKGTERGLNPNAYPAVDWYDMLFRDNTNQQRFNLNVRGGGVKARYYVAGSYTHDNGLIKSDPSNPFQSNINLDRFLLRANVNIDLSPKTEMVVRLHSTLDNLKGPLQGGNAMYNAAIRTSPVRFAPIIEPTGNLVGVPHITFGNDYGPRGSTTSGNEAAWFNPYAELQRGYRDTRRQLSLVQLELNQKLDVITQGLSLRFLGNANTSSYFENRRAYSPYFYRIQSYDQLNDTYSMVRTKAGLEALQLEPGSRTNSSVFYAQTAIDYVRSFNKHNTQGLVVALAQEFLDANAYTVAASLPSRNLGISGRFNYDYDNRYFAEVNFGYNGSERFATDNRWGFFPSFGVGWLVSNEKFFAPLSNTISRLKFRTSFGWVGNDKIGSSNASDRFFYLSEVNLASGQAGSTYGKRFDKVVNGVSISRYANARVTWERARKMNIGMDLNLHQDAIQLRVDYFTETRSSILQTRSDIPSTLGLQAPLKSNVGAVEAWGVDGSLDINHSFANQLWVTARGTYTFSDNRYKVYEEPNYAAIGAPWVSNIGNNVNVSKGLIAERLFVDDEEARNSPQQFGTPGLDYGGGDLKYKDLNKDGVITALDLVPIGKPTVPKVTYGFGASMGYKKIDFNVFFQGLAETSFSIDPVRTGPFVNSITGTLSNDPLTLSSANGILSENGLIQAYADNHWSEENPDVYALWPRLSTTINANNTPNSTWWIRDGSFVRLKQLEVGYTAIKNTKKWGMSNLRVYVTGTNLFTWSAFKMWDPELGGNGFNYPLQKVFNLGIQVGF